jgi:long-chain acyl-CoA synthetase
MSVTAALSIHAQRSPGVVALAFERHRISWLRLDQAVHRLAAHIASTVPVEQSVALHLQNGPTFALLFLAVARAGREAQVLDPAWPAELVQRVLERLSHPLLVTSERPLIEGRSAISADPFLDFEVVADTLGAPRTYLPVAEPEPSRSFYVGFTSGSTGIPKGYRRNHQSWLDGFSGDESEFRIGADDVVLAAGAMTHSLFLYAFVRGINAGAKVVLCRQFRASSLPRLVRHEGVTIVYGVPTQLRLIMDFADRAQESPLEKVRLILSTGAKWSLEDSPRLKRLFPSAEFAEFYGCSELSYVTLAKDSEIVPSGSVGRAFPGVTITIRDHGGNELPAGRAGLVFAESPLLFMGYACGGEGGSLLRVGNAMSVGDVGFLDEQGFLHLVGRSNRMIICSGKNVHPEEIEEVLRSHPAISTVAVVGMPDEQRGERLVALLQYRNGRTVTRADIIVHARTRLPLYKVPRTYGAVANWPVTPLGKPDFASLRRMWETGECEMIL